MLSKIPEADRAVVVSEVLQSLPPAMTSQYPKTHELVTSLIRKELEVLRGRVQQNKPTDGPKEREAEIGPGERKEPKAGKVRKQ